MEMIGLKIREILEQAGVGTKQTKRSVVSDCPQAECSAEQKLYIEKANGRSICFKCNTRWSPQGVLASILKMSYTEASTVLFGNDIAKKVQDQNLDLKLDIEEDLDFIETEDIEDLIEVALDPLFIPVELSTEGMAYLARRGVSDLALIHRHGLLYSATMNAVVFVVKDNRSRVVGWQARLITPFNPKIRMLTYEGMPKARILYNYNPSTCDKNLILVEGPFDCVKSDVPGYTSVASLGKGVSAQQIEMLLESPAENIYLGLDRDAASEVQMLSEKLCTKKNVFRILPPDNRKDFGECIGHDEIYDSISNAQKCYPEKTSRLEVYLKKPN